MTALPKSARNIFEFFNYPGHKIVSQIDSGSIKNHRSHDCTLNTAADQCILAREF